MTHSVTDNFKSRDASASKKWQIWGMRGFDQWCLILEIQCKRAKNIFVFSCCIKIDIWISLRLPCICVCRLKAAKCGKYFCCNSQPYFSFSVQGWGRAGPHVFLFSKHKLLKMFKFKRWQLEHSEDGCYKEWYTPPLFLAAKIKQNPKGFPAAYLEVKISQMPWESTSIF